MEKEVFQIDASKLKDIDEGLSGAGYYRASVNEPVPEDEIRNILGTLRPDERRNLAGGRSSIVPRGRTTFTNGRDDISVVDFDLVSNRRVHEDPVVIVKERVKGRTSDIVREILQDVVKVDIVKFGLKSMLSKEFKTSIADLARLEGTSPKILYRKYCDILIESAVRGVKSRRLDIAGRVRPELVSKKRLEIEA